MKPPPKTTGRPGGGGRRRRETIRPYHGTTLSSTPAGYELQRGNVRVKNPDTALLEVSERIYRVSVDPNLEMEMGAKAVTGAPDVADHLALRDLSAARDRI
jgi:hypothetical protein